MIVSRTPFRISFFGGGTDYPVWYREHGGAVLAITIDKYCYISCRYLPPFFEHKSRIVYSKVEVVHSNDQIEHPAVRAILRHLNVTQGVEIHHDGDLPARSGLGSSSAFTVCLLHALYALRRRMPTKVELANAAIHVEQELLKEYTGCQDQILAAYGGFSRIDFPAHATRKYTYGVNPIIVNLERLQELHDHLLLFFTGISRVASEIAKEQVVHTNDHTRELSTMHQMVDEGIAIVTSARPVEAFGELLHESWLLKRSLSSKISLPTIDAMYETARRAGAIGGKLLGAGGGGFLLLFARPEDHGRIQEHLKGLLRVPFRFEQEGSRIVVYDPDASAGHGSLGDSGMTVETSTSVKEQHHVQTA